MWEEKFTNKFSIIIPCYNAEPYLERCLNSIISQSYKNFEIIIINDGSSDKSLEIIKKYLNIFGNIKCINQKNQGVAIARNNGINQISGNKFIFVDADDYINPDLLWHLNEVLKKRNSDIIRFNANLITTEGVNEKKYFCAGYDLIDGKTALKFFVDSNVRYGPLWLYCYDTNFFKANNFSFIENKIHEDFYNIYILSKASSIQCIDYIGYNYVKNDTGITSSKDKNKELNRAQDILYVYDYVIKRLEESFGDRQNDFNYIYGDVLMFLNIALKYLEGEDKENYLREINIRKRLRRK